jgi:hypothetical protein
MDYHFQLFVNAYNHARRLKTLRGLAPCEFDSQARTKERDRFRHNPSHHTSETVQVGAACGTGFPTRSARFLPGAAGTPLPAPGPLALPFGSP